MDESQEERLDNVENRIKNIEETTENKEVEDIVGSMVSLLISIIIIAIVLYFAYLYVAHTENLPAVKNAFGKLFNHQQPTQ